MKIGLTVPVLNNWSGLTLGLNSLRTCHQMDYCIVDNSCLHLSVAGSWNLGLATLFRRDCDYVLVCNDDIIFAPCTIDAMVSRISIGDAALVSAWNLKGQIEPEQIFQVIESARDSESENPDFSCFMITKDCWEQVGPFDENFYPAYGEDNDYHGRIVLSGKKAILTTTAPYYHYVSVTQLIAQKEGRQLPLSPAYAMKYFTAKWGHLPVDNPSEMWNLYYRVPFNDQRYTLRDWPDPADIEKLQGVLG